MDMPNSVDSSDKSDNPVSPASDPVVSELKGIRGTLDNISRKVDAWAVEDDIDQPEKSEKEKGSLRLRTIAALGMAAIMGKAGAILGAKVGFIAGGVRDRFSSFRGLGKVKNLSDMWILIKAMYWAETTLGVMAGSLLGLLSGGALGFTRGDRIKNPKEFFSHPLKSFSTVLFGEDKKQPVKTADETKKAPIDAGADPDHSDMWQARVQPPVEPAQIQR